MLLLLKHVLLLLVMVVEMWRWKGRWWREARN